MVQKLLHYSLCPILRLCYCEIQHAYVHMYVSVCTCARMNICMSTCVLVLIRKTINYVYFMQDNQTPFDLAVYYGESAVVSLFVNKYKMDIKQYDQVTKIHNNNMYHLHILYSYAICS